MKILEYSKDPLILVQGSKFYNYRLVTERKERDLTLEEISEIARINVSTLVGYEELRRFPQESKILGVAQILGTSIQYLLPVKIRELTRSKFLSNGASLTLTSKEKWIMGMYFGVGYDTHYTLKEIGEKFEYNVEEVKLLKDGMLYRLKNAYRFRDVLKEKN